VPKSVEGRGVTVEEAKRAALAELGVRESDAVVEVLAESRRGLFGGGKKAHVRVTIRDEAATPVAGEAATAEPPAEAGAAGAATAPAEDADVEALSPEERLELLDREADLAADFLEGLLDRLDLPGDLEIEVQENQAIVNIQDVGSGLLIGRRGATLDALQELVRGAVQRQTQRRSYVRVDVESYRTRQLEKLRDKCRDAIAQARETGQPVRLEPMDPYERKMMHDLVANTRGVQSYSEGIEPRRRVVVAPGD
jgi:spoIIIJ-associated protein